ncbi:hypothetical protein HPP92_014270 [Vanilla planifolia]|uniref:guanylate kinase n=1 Tax=Vanilla planifolia TaxID=51239 RepID=A0A835UVJ5_VANPL|nr:hypothetical protein HPP92_014270 [Vanilla planifolia]
MYNGHYQGIFFSWAAQSSSQKLESILGANILHFKQYNDVNEVEGFPSLPFQRDRGGCSVALLIRDCIRALFIDLSDCVCEEEGEEAPECLLVKFEKCFSVGFDSETRGYQTVTSIGDKIYNVVGSEDLSKSSIEVKVFDKSAGIWLEPVVFGTKPISYKGHSATVLDNTRLLILLMGSPLDSSIWFLEVDSPFVKLKKKLIGTEVVAWSKGLTGNGSKPIVISGPSGVGKGTLIAKLMKEFPSTFGFSVSHTTRAPREKELNGVDYHFTERSKMEKDIQNGKFLESALVHGNLYGTSIEAVDVVSNSGKICILDIDVQGARSVRASSSKQYLSLFALLLSKSLRPDFVHETEEQIQKRLRNAKAELDHAKIPGLFDHMLLNDELESCYQNLKKLLTLDDITEVPSPNFMKNFTVPVSHSISKVDQNIMIQCGANETCSTPCLITIDASSLKGGAPGRTRGLSIHSSFPEEHIL